MLSRTINSTQAFTGINLFFRNGKSIQNHRLPYIAGPEQNMICVTRTSFINGQIISLSLSYISPHILHCPQYFLSHGN